MPHTEASDPETSWKSAAKETAPWSQPGVCYLLHLGAHCDWNGEFLPCTSGSGSLSGCKVWALVGSWIGAVVKSEIFV